VGDHTLNDSPTKISFFSFFSRFSPTGDGLFAVSTDTGSISFHKKRDLAGHSIAVGSCVFDMAWAPSGNKLVHTKDSMAVLMDPALNTTVAVGSLAVVH
jgi:hypothetical protein